MSQKICSVKNSISDMRKSLQTLRSAGWSIDHAVEEVSKLLDIVEKEGSIVEDLKNKCFFCEHICLTGHTHRYVPIRYSHPCYLSKDRRDCESVKKAGDCHFKGKKTLSEYIFMVPNDGGGWTCHVREGGRGSNSVCGTIEKTDCVLGNNKYQFQFCDENPGDLRYHHALTLHEARELAEFLKLVTENDGVF